MFSTLWLLACLICSSFHVFVLGCARPHLDGLGFHRVKRHPLARLVLPNSWFIVIVGFAVYRNAFVAVRPKKAVEVLFRERYRASPQYHTTAGDSLPPVVAFAREILADFFTFSLPQNTPNTTLIPSSSSKNWSAVQEGIVFFNSYFSSHTKSQVDCFQNRGYSSKAKLLNSI